MPEFDGKWGYLVIDGKYYQHDEKDGKLILKEVPDKKIKAMEKQAEKIADALKEHLDVGKVLKEAVMRLKEKDIKKLHRVMFESKREYKPKTREHHCVDMKIGNYILPLVD